MENSKQQLVEKLKAANNILVTVRTNPSVDQLAACLGLTLILNKLGKHATAVFSGEIPSTLEFLEPEQTIEKNTDSLRDFIIALDKSKADKLRYKVEDTVVKIFITPYKTSIGEDDLEFSQGDFNVDVVVALGVQEQEDLDQVITAHGRILHDATVTSVNTDPNGGIGSINWIDPNASSLSELVVEASHDLGKDLLDGQIATALLTGVVAETERFSNDKTTPQAMSVSAELMAAGANQQLVATKLEESAAEEAAAAAKEDVSIADESQEADGQPAPPKNDDGTLEIRHREGDEPAGAELPEPEDPSAQEGSEAGADRPTQSPARSYLLDDNDTTPGPDVPKMGAADTEFDPLSMRLVENKRLPDATEPVESAATAPAPKPEESEPTPEPEPETAPEESKPTPPKKPDEPVEIPLEKGQIRIDDQGNLHSNTYTPKKKLKLKPAEAAPPAPQVPAQANTLEEIEKSVNSPHVDQPEPAAEDTARDQVFQALNSAPSSTPTRPIHALNAQPLGANLRPDQSRPANEPPPIAASPADKPMDMPLPPGADSAQPAVPPDGDAVNPSAPPPVPPPMMPPPGFVDPNKPDQT